MRWALQSSAACDKRSLLDETKFQNRKRWPSSGSPPITTHCTGPLPAVTTGTAPASIKAMVCGTSATPSSSTSPLIG